MKIALAQLNTTADPAANLERIEAIARQAAGQGARLVQFPEAATCAFDGDVAAFARDHAEAAHAALAALAAELRVALVVGSFTPAEDGRTFNTLLAFLPEGGRRAYDKIHLFDAFGHRESETIAAGTSPVSFSYGGVRFGLTTCYDVRFPELYTRLARDGAQAILVSASWGDGPGKAAQWDLLTRARALDSTCWILAAGQAVRDPEAEGEPTSAPLGVGHSGLIAPDGTESARAGAEEDLVLAELDVDAVDALRRVLPVLRNSRLVHP